MSKAAQSRKAREAFRARYPHPNLLTPDVIAYGMVGSDLAWELSSGEGIRFSRDTPPSRMYGVTVLQLTNGPQALSRGDLSQCFHSEADARAYIHDGFQRPESTEALALIQEIMEGDAQ